MKKLLFILVLLPFFGNAQRLQEYKASNQVNYKVKDTVQLGLGSGLQGTFVHLKMAGIMTGSSTQIGSAYSNSAVVIKKIKKHKLKGKETIFFIVGGGNITNYSLQIEAAIQTCEVMPCEKEQDYKAAGKYDKLAKLKQLLDNGAISKEEYNIEKEKILNH